MSKKEVASEMINSQKKTRKTKVDTIQINKSKEIVCNKCGEIHDANLIKCPNCGYNRFTTYVKYFVGSLLVTFLLFTSIFTIVKFVSIENKIDVLGAVVSDLAYNTDSNSSSDEIPTYDITTASYYYDYLVNDNIKLDDLGDEYILYFHQKECEFCKEANAFIDAYFQAGANEVVPIYFVTPESAPMLFNNEMFGKDEETGMTGITSTPTFVKMSKSDIVQTVIGPDEGYALLDPIVRSLDPNN